MKDLFLIVILIAILLYIFAMFFMPKAVPGSEIWRVDYGNVSHNDPNLNVNNFSIEQFRKDLGIIQ